MAAAREAIEELDGEGEGEGGRRRHGEGGRLRADVPSRGESRRATPTRCAGLACPISRRRAFFGAGGRVDEVLRKSSRAAEGAGRPASTGGRKARRARACVMCGERESEACEKWCESGRDGEVGAREGRPSRSTHPCRAPPKCVRALQVTEEL
eukprot:3034318-Prymnesium_polylepis.3